MEKTEREGHVEDIMAAKEKLDNVFNQWSDGAVTTLELQTYIIHLLVYTQNFQVFEAFPEHKE